MEWEFEGKYGSAIFEIKVVMNDEKQYVEFMGEESVRSDILNVDQYGNIAIVCVHIQSSWISGVHTKNEYQKHDIIKYYQRIKEKRENEKRVKIMKEYGVDEWEIKKSENRCVHTVKINDEKFQFSERNIFDFGRVVNPMYEVIPGKKGGLAKQTDDGKWFWETWKDGEREITGNELKAYLMVNEQGPLRGSGIRM